MGKIKKMMETFISDNYNNLQKDYWGRDNNIADFEEFCFIKYVEQLTLKKIGQPEKKLRLK